MVLLWIRATHTWKRKFLEVLCQGVFRQGDCPYGCAGYCPVPEDNDNDNDTQERSTNIRQRSGLTSVSEGVITPREKESDKAVVPCALGKVGDCDTVDDSVQSQKRGTMKAQAIAETSKK